MKKLVLLFTILAFSFTFCQKPKVKTGIEVLEATNFKILKGKKVGLITNPTGVDSKLKSTVDILNESNVCKVVALYGPEHGVRGDFSAGDSVGNTVDKATGIPLYSLYGKNHKPSPEILKGIDVLVYDIQDIGCRSYTYISTMGLAMEAAAENNIEFVVLDRPNPLGGKKVEGNITEDKYISFVSQYKIPYVYGLTCGELAKMLNGEGMLKNGVKCKLTVVPMKGWKRKMSFDETGLPWVPTSPHIPNAETAKYYVTTGILGELEVVSEGVGYPIPFQTFAADWIDANSLANKMNALNIKGVSFRPIHFKPYYGTLAKKEIHGVQIYIKDFNKFNATALQFQFMQVNNQLYPNKNLFKLTDTSRTNMFDKVCGADNIRKLFSQNFQYSDIQKYLEKDVKSFCNKSKRYYLYK
jgi:uncharacterized protein YbbC (DUF1343 family)